MVNSLMAVVLNSIVYNRVYFQTASGANTSSVQRNLHELGAKIQMRSSEMPPGHGQHRTGIFGFG